MAIANMAAIAAKVNESIASDKIRSKASAKIDGAAQATAKYAAEDFCDVMKQAIRSSGVSSNVAEAISDMYSGAPIKIGYLRYHVYISFSNNLYRPSLDVSHYGGINNLAALYNNGANGGERMKQVHGVWHGVDYWSNPVIPERHFVQNAIDTFIGTRSGQYDYIKITPSSIYK